MRKIELFSDTFAIILLLAFFTMQLPMTIAASYMVVVVFMILKWRGLNIRFDHFAFMLVCLLFLAVPPLTLNHGLTPFFYLLLSPILLFFAYSFAENSLIHIESVLKNVYWLFVFFISVALLLNWDEPEPLGAIFSWVSTNGIPSYLIVVQIAYSISYFLKNNRLPLLSCLATLIVAVFGLGRGSMIVAALILLFSILLNLYVLKSRVDRTVTFRVILCLFVPLVFFIAAKSSEIDIAISTWIEGSKFSSGVLDEHRGRILKDYWDKMDGFSLFFGADYDGTSINDNYGGNPHNSFIRVHSFYGMFAFISVFLPLLFVLISGKKLRQKVVFLVLVMLALLRAVSEPIFFPSTLDFFYFLYFFIFFKHSQSIKNG